MASVTLHTGILTSPKFVPLSDGALRLWVNGLCWSKEHLTDGFIPVGMLPSLHRQGTKHVAELLRVQVPGKQPLWHQEPSGYRIHDFSDWQDSADAVQSRRRKWRDQKRGTTSTTDSTTDSTEEADADSRGESLLESIADSRSGVGSGVGSGTSDDDSEIEGRPRLRSVEAVASSSSTAHGSGPHHIALLELVSLWNRVRSTSNRVDPAHLGRKARIELAEAVRTKSLDAWEATFTRVEASDYLAGRGDMPGLTLWKAIDLAERIDAGQYDPKREPETIAQRWDREDTERAARTAGDTR